MQLSWVIEGKLAGSSKPTKRDLPWLKRHGIQAIVSLTEVPLDPHLVRFSGFEFQHIPIIDFTAPSQAQIDEYVAFVDKMLTLDKPVLTHCLAGLGRTGTMLACYLVHLCWDSHDAINEVRRKRPRSVEIESQVNSIYIYARRLGKWG
ncbi:MAG: dual specificity protein phosphatase 23 [Candidatus Heimdallarchaeota archaeon]